MHIVRRPVPSLACYGTGLAWCGRWEAHGDAKLVSVSTGIYMEFLLNPRGMRCVHTGVGLQSDTRRCLHWMDVTVGGCAWLSNGTLDK